MDRSGYCLIKVIHKHLEGHTSYCIQALEPFLHFANVLVKDNQKKKKIKSSLNSDCRHMFSIIHAFICKRLQRSMQPRGKVI